MIPFHKLLAQIPLGLTLAAGFYGCATSPQPGEPPMEPTQRFYPHTAPEKILTASQRIFLLAEGGEVEWYRRDNRLRVIRGYGPLFFAFPTIGHIIWDIEADPQRDGVLVKVRLSDHPKLPSYAPDQDVSESVRLFFLRLDYMMGYTDEWVSCDQAGASVLTGKLRYLCLTASDRRPH